MEQTLTDLDFLKTHVPEFEGYRDEIARHHTDQRVRASAGSMLADVQTRLAGTLDAPAQEALERAIFRCQFPDQVFTTRLDVAEVDDELERTLAVEDRRLVELAERARDARAAELPSILGEFSAAFDRRRQGAPAQPPPPLV